MALILAITPGAPSASGASGGGYFMTAGGAQCRMIVSVQNTSGSDVTLTALSINENTESDAQISQPVFMTPNTPIGTGNPTIAAGTTAYYSFGVVLNSPQLPGNSIPNTVGSVVPPQNAAYLADDVFGLTATAIASDGSIGSVSQPIYSVNSQYQTSARQSVGTMVYAQNGNFITGIIFNLL